MKRLVLINILLMLLLSILPKESAAETILTVAKNETVETVSSRSLDAKREEIASYEIQDAYMQVTSISQSGIDFIMKYEGCKLEAYRLKGEAYYTIGYGHHGADVKAGRVISQEEAETLLIADLQGYTNQVLDHCKYLELTQNELDALVSFTYNTGLGNLKKLTANGTRTKEEIAEKILNYTKSSSESNRKGLAKRRMAEQEMFKGGVTNEI